MTPPTPSTPASVPFRVIAVGAFVAIVAWLSVVIGVGVLDVVSRPWCSPGTCEEIFRPRLLVAAIGGIAGFVLCGFGLLTQWRTRKLALYVLTGIVLTAATGAWFLPVLNA